MRCLTLFVSLLFISNFTANPVLAQNSQEMKAYVKKHISAPLRPRAYENSLARVMPSPNQYNQLAPIPAHPKTSETDNNQIGSSIQIPIFLAEARYFGSYCQRIPNRKIVDQPEGIADYGIWYNISRSWNRLRSVPDGITMIYDNNGTLSDIRISETLQNQLGLTEPNLKAYLYSHDIGQEGEHYFLHRNKPPFNSKIQFIFDIVQYNEHKVFGIISRVVERRYNPTLNSYELCWEGVAFGS